MPLLGGIFTRRHKAPSSSRQVDSQTASTTTTQDGDHAQWSPTDDTYVTPDTQGPSVPNGRSYLHPDAARADSRTINYNGYRSDTLSPIPSSSTLAMPSSSSKLRLPFGRKKSAKPQASGFVSAPEDEVPPHSGGVSLRPPFMGRASTSSAMSSDVEHSPSRRLGPPPSRSAVFAAYADPNSALSTRSLPHDPSSSYARSEPPPPVPKQSKRPSLFAWAKSNNNKSLSVPRDDHSQQSLSPVTSNGGYSISNASDANASFDASNSSFNLKSFRHVMPATTSPTQSNASNVSLATPGLSTPTPRPRGDSMYNSDSGSQQRISVAAFREAQARRSMAGSPSPSQRRSPSPLPPSPALGNEERGRYGSGPRPSRSSPHIPHATPAALQQRRKSGMSFARTSLYASDTDESEGEEEEDSEDDSRYGRPATTLARKPTVKDRFGKGRAKSELGHGSSFTTRREDSFDNSRPSYSGPNSKPVPSSSKSHLGHGESYTSSSSSTARPPMPNYQPPPSRSQTGLSNNSSDYGNPTSRQRASNSTSALTPSAAAKRASVVAAANAANDAEEAAMHLKRASRHIRDTSVTSNPDESLERQAKKASTHLGHGSTAIPPSNSSRIPVTRPQAQPVQQHTPQSQHQRQTAIAALTADSDSDSDNTPLATLVAPRRPGSAMSSYSTGNVSVSGRSVGGTPHPPPHKPLIDIKELTGGSTNANRSGSAPTIAMLGSNPLKSMDGFTGGRTLLAQTDGGSGGNSPSSTISGRGQKPRSSSVGAGALTHTGSSPLASQSDAKSSYSRSPPPAPEKVFEAPLTTSPTMMATHLTSKIAPFNFVSPPGTPKREEVKTMGLGLPSSRSQQRPDDKPQRSPRKLSKSPPPRSATMPITMPPISSSSSSSTPGGPEKKDPFAERLERLVKKTVSGDQAASGSHGTVSPAATSPVAPSVLSANRGRTESPAPVASPSQASFLPARQQTSPPPTSRAALAAPQPMHPQPRIKMTSPAPSRPMTQVEQSTPSPPDQSLAELLGAGVALISFTGESDNEQSNANSDSDSGSEESEDNYGYDSLSGFRKRGGEQQQATKKGHKREETIKPRRKDSQETEEEEWEKVKADMEEAKPITPIPIKQRTPLPSFSVTSRPQLPRNPDTSSSQGQSQGSSNRQSGYSVFGGSGGTSTSNASVSGASSVSGTSSGGGRRESVASSYSLFGPTSTSGSTVADNRPPNTRKRSSTMIPISSTSSTLHAPTNGNGKPSSPIGSGETGNPNVDSRSSALRTVGATSAPQQQQQQQQPRPRSSTLVPAMPQPVQPPQQPMPGMGMGAQNYPSRPFAMRRDSPASSTGESSSGRAPLTPRDGSDIGGRGRNGAPVDRETQYSGGASGLGINTRPGRGKQMKRRSVSFEDEAVRDGNGSGSGPERGRASREFLAPKSSKEEERGVSGRKEQEMEERRKERRREEAKAAIELGNVINGPGPNLDDDDDMSINQVNQRMSAMNPMMMGMQQQQPGMAFPPGTPQQMPPGWGMGGMQMSPMNMNMNPMGMNPMGMGMPQNPMLSPAQFMLPPPPNSDPTFMAAHQQAMMIAKQAYQMAVAQQAMAAAADEWERSSNMGAFSSAGSVYGGGGGPTMSPGPFGMMGGMQQSGWSSAGSAIFPSSRSMYGGANMSSSRSEYGGGMGGGGGGGLAPNWSSSRSSYGDLGSSSTQQQARGSMYGQQMYPNMPPIPASASGGKMNGNGNGNGQGRMRTTSGPANLRNGVKKAAPPSSWKAAI